jgi:hypothetical protein
MNQIHELCAIFTCISNSCENTKGKYLNSLPTTVMEVSFVFFIRKNSYQIFQQ